MRELGRTASLFHPVGAGTVCGAALYVSPAAACVMAGGPPGAPSPVPGIPDVVAQVYRHTGSHRGSALDGPVPAGRDRVPEPAWWMGEWRESWSRDEHAAAVAAVREAIGRGDVYQVNVVGHASAPYAGDPRPALERVAGLPGARYGGVLSGVSPAGAAVLPGRSGPGVAVPAGTGSGEAAGARRAASGVAVWPGRAASGVAVPPGRAVSGVRFAGPDDLSDIRLGGDSTNGGWAIATASPETLVEVRAGRVITRPIKGTRPATAAGRRELLASAKERAEHIMIVDLARNDLSRLAGLGPVAVDELFAVRRWCGLWQAESVVSAPIAGPVSLADLLRAICPGGSVTGAPKLAALAEIGRLEPVGRGVSMGALGWVGTGYVDLGLTIRTVAATRGRLHMWAGGGITWDSDPVAEVDEAAAKAAPIRAALAG